MSARIARALLATIAVTFAACDVESETSTTPPEGDAEFVNPQLWASPRFAATGEPGSVLAQAGSSDDPVRSMDLITLSGSGTPLATTAMSPGRDDFWRAELPTGSLNTIKYVVRASYDHYKRDSRLGFFTWLDEIATVAPGDELEAGRQILAAPLGDGERELGIDAGCCAGTVPNSFAVDEDAGEIYVADTAKDRVVTYDLSGNWVGAKEFKDARALADIAVVPGTDVRYIIDHPYDRIIEWTPRRTTVWKDAGLRDEVVPQVVTAGRDGVYLKRSEGTQVPLIRDVPLRSRKGIVREPARSAAAAGGFTTESAVAGINVGMHNLRDNYLLIGDVCQLVWGDTQRRCNGTRGLRIDVPGVSSWESMMDRSGNLWLLVSSYSEKADEFRDFLYRVDVLEETAEFREVDVNYSGDVTRQLAPLRDGVVLMDGDDDSIRLRQFR